MTGALEPPKKFDDMSTTPLVSIVMCAYNGLPYIKEAVGSILNQTYTNWELIITDDGSNDGTREWLREHFGEHPRIRLFFQEKNLGYVANKNFGHRQAKGEYITQLDNDDACAPNRLEKQMDVVRRLPHIKIVGCGYRRIDDQGVAYGEEAAKEDIIFEEKPAEEYPFWFPSLLVHKSVFEAVGYFDEYFAGALGDDVYWAVLANTKFPIYCLKDVLYDYRNNPNSITNEFGNLRKLIMPAVLAALYRQQRGNKGVDILSARKFDKLQAMEQRFLANKAFMAEQYRICAAKAIDKKDRRLSLHLLGLALRKNPRNLSIYRTIMYFMRREFHM